MKKLIIYHNEDNDGLFSMAIARHFEENFDSFIDILGLNYSEQKRIVEGSQEVPMTWYQICNNYDKIIIVDFSFPLDQMVELYNIYKDSFVWCDHHGPVIEAAKEIGLKVSGIQGTTHSAIYNTWFYYTNEPIPELLNALQLWDSWTFTEENRSDVTKINVGITHECELEPDKIQEYFYRNILNTENMHHAILRAKDIGEILMKEQNRKNRQIIQRSGDCSFTVGPDNNRACLIVYSTGTGSGNFASLKGTDIKHGIVLRRNANGIWNMSIYNINDNEDFHCGSYLREMYGGGGHKGAGGCELSWEQILNIFETKHA